MKIRSKDVDVRGGAHKILLAFAEHVWPSILTAAQRRNVSVSKFVRDAAQQAAQKEAKNVSKNSRQDR